jgi:hypothetical protein
LSESILSIRPYLELAYFAAGVLLLIGLVITFFQLTLIKNDIGLRNERAAKEHAIEAAIRYLNLYVPLCDANTRDLLEKKIASYSGPIGDFSFASNPKSMLAGTITRMATSSSFHLALNELESISAYFTTGVADERTGFLIIGRTFCGTVEAWYDVIAGCRREKAHPYWHNIVQLYQTWRPRLSKAEIQTTIRDLESKIKSMGPDSPIEPIHY